MCIVWSRHSLQASSQHASLDAIFTSGTTSVSDRLSQNLLKISDSFQFFKFKREIQVAFEILIVTWFGVKCSDSVQHSK